MHTGCERVVVIYLWNFSLPSDFSTLFFYGPIFFSSSLPILWNTYVVIASPKTHTKPRNVNERSGLFYILTSKTSRFISNTNSILWLCVQNIYTDETCIHFNDTMSEHKHKNLKTIHISFLLSGSQTFYSFQLTISATFEQKLKRWQGSKTRSSSSPELVAESEKARQSTWPALDASWP